MLTSVLAIAGQVGGGSIAMSALRCAVTAATGYTSVLVAALGQLAISKVPVPTGLGCGRYESHAGCR